MEIIEKTDADIISEIAKLKDDYAKAEKIKTLKNDEDKIAELAKLKNEDAKIEVIKILKEDKDKITELAKLKDDYAKAEVIKILKKDEDKIAELAKLKDDDAKIEIIKFLKENKNRIKAVEYLSDDRKKEEVIIMLENERLKIEEIYKLPDSSRKAKLLITFANNENALKQMFLKKSKIYTRIGLNEKMTFGIEIESEGDSSDLLLEKENLIHKWKTKLDGSVIYGVEVVSPILKDDTKSLEDIYVISGMLQAFGQKITADCGGHIHIGADYLKSKEAYVNLLEIWGNTEKIIFKMCNEEENTPRSRLAKYAASISPKLNAAIEKGTINLESEEDLNLFIKYIQTIQETRYSGLNLLNINNNGKNTIEFRVPNGTINPDTWIENIRLFGRIVEMSQKIAEIANKTEKSEEEKRIIELKEGLKADNSEEEKKEILLKLLFTEEEQEIYRKRYASCSKKLEQLPDGDNPLKDEKFAKVNFCKDDKAK